MVNDIKSTIKFIYDRKKINDFCKYLNLQDMNIIYEDIVKQLDNKKLKINNFLLFIQKYNIYIDIKIFYDIFLIYYCPSSKLLQFCKNSESLISANNNLIYIIKYFDPYDNFCILKFINKLNKFNIEYKKWYHTDRIDIIKYLFLQYHRYENIKNFNSNCLKFQNIIIDKIKKLNGIEIFNNLKKKDIIYDNYFYNKIKHLKYVNIKNKLYEDLNNNPIKSNYIITLLYDIVYTFEDVTKNNFDISSLNNLKYNFNIQDLLLFIKKLFKLIKEHESYEIYKFSHKIYDNFINSIINGEKLSIYLPDVIQNFFNSFTFIKIEKIKVYQYL